MFNKLALRSTISFNAITSIPPSTIDKRGLPRYFGTELHSHEHLAPAGGDSGTSTGQPVDGAVDPGEHPNAVSHLSLNTV